MNDVFKLKRTDFLLVAFLTLMSGSPVLGNPKFMGAVGICALLYSINRGDYVLRSSLWKYLLFFVIIYVGQYITLGTISLLGSVNVLGKIVFGATVMWYLKERFRDIYLYVMYFFSCISLVCFLLEIAGIYIPDLFPTQPSRHSVLVYNSLIFDEHRNSGPFWEPGAFACYLILVPLLYVDNLRDFVHSQRKEIFILFVALITTFSTTGYICLAVIVVYYLIVHAKNQYYAYFIYLPLLLFSMYVIYDNLPFLGEKIETQVDETKVMEGNFSNTRMGSLEFDEHYIKKHPFCGNGLIEKTRYADHKELWGLHLGHGNGFSNFIAQMGIPAMFMYLLMVYKVFFKKYIVLLVVVLLLQGEQLLNYPLFLSLPFVILSVNNNSKTKNILYRNNETNCNYYNSIQS